MKAIEFLNQYFNNDEYFIIAQKYPKKGDKVKHYHTQLSLLTLNLEKYLGRFYYLNKDDNVDIYFSLNSYQKQSSRYPKRTELLVSTIKSFYFDIDKGNVEAKKDEIMTYFGQPTFIIESSKNKFQFIYQFDMPIQANEEVRKEFKQLLKGLCYHFDVDKTFDTARIFRLVGYKNKKPHNNDFVVRVNYFPYTYNYKDFKEKATPFLIEKETTIKQQKKKIEQESKNINQKNSSSIPSNFDNFLQFKDIKKIPNSKYIKLLKKYNYDKSTTDLAYAKWLRYQKNITEDEIIILKIFQARGYDNLIEKHGYQLDYYFQNILEKSH